VFSKIVSKVLVDKGILGGRGKEVFFLIFLVLGLIGGDVGKNVKTDDGGGGDRGTGDNIGRAIRDIEEGEVLDVVKGGPDRSGRGRVLKLGGLRDDGLENAGSDIKRTWVIPSVVRALEDLKDGGGGVCNVLLVDVIKGGPGGDRDVGEGRGDDDGGLKRSERHLIQLASLWRLF